MAAVLQFENKRKHLSSASQQTAGPAEIILFTGVRFERLESAEESARHQELAKAGESSLLNRAV